ncbi:translocase [Rhodobaculum claviforme]|uniref:Protein translocase subunit SecA n=1 Tax=Rhodobaculum claviforme TaxID=1549854 RepID=A0A934WJU0_9RHOB|nr:translocase [Rhodobaculum claviforme]MBK5928396.1 translocase [Rhodobaculum claviforme]
MAQVQGLLGFGRLPRGTAPYQELADPVSNFVDRWLERRVGGLLSRLPLTRLRLSRQADRVLALAPRMAVLDDAALVAEAVRLRRRLLSRPGDRAALERAFAVVREVSARTLGKTHYKVQIMGALALHAGHMVEMATGEGKTLTAAPAAVVAALSGMPVHVVTVNDYLAARDAEELRPIFDFLGLTVGVIDSDMEAPARAAAYRCDITYISNKNLTFDYLRDRVSLRARRGLGRRRMAALMAGRPDDGLMLRGLAFAIVDEADSVFVDEARTPLILSSSSDDAEAAALYATALALARALGLRRDFAVDAMNRHITLTDAGKARLSERAAGLEGLWRVRRAREELVRQALAALTLFEHGRDYVVSDGKVQIVDEFTGRIMPDRSWQGGLHQLIEAKEGVAVTGRKETMARITYQRFFRRYARLSGMTGTGMELAGEFRDTFGLSTVRIPTHRPLRRRHLGTRFVPDEGAKWAAVADRVMALAGPGQPVLVGTRSVEASERCAAVLAARGLQHVVLNARQDGEEAEVVARAGLRGAVTVATNIAGRGTDIKLGPGVAGLGGLHVILTEFHESARIDRQLYGRSGRQGDPGSTEAIVALTDDLFVRFAPWLLAVVRRAPLPPLCGLLRRVAQARAEAEHFTTRTDQTTADRDFERALAFAGPQE